MTLKLRIACLVVPVLSLAAAPQAFAQSEGRNVLGAFLGFTDRTDTDFTVGAEYEYLYTPQLSFGGIVEYTPDAYGQRSASVVMGTVNFRVMPKLKITGGAGVELNDFNDRFRARIGAGYDVLDGPITVTPRVAIDFGDGDESLVFGAVLSQRF